MAVFAESFIFGLTSSLHCAGMCGPLAACALGGGGGAAAYHLSRIAAYTTAGALAGTLGLAAAGAGVAVPSAWISLFLGGSLLLFALGVYRHLGRVPGAGAVLQRTARWSAGRGPLARATALGALTPLLPCGLLYAVYGAAFLTGSSQQGALTMLGFALGSLPVLALAQAQMGWIRRVLGAGGRDVVQRAAMAAAAAVLLWRGWAGLYGGACCG